ncbi:unnamed protein product, partial [Meganyctiphanes norvegica]|uniref:Ankyrin repeat domain-containing protein n=1 Tax=Meganyctiphanes norvegica TaxID=48144 RepID=A0AAV2SRK1_MEGNR
MGTLATVSVLILLWTIRVVPTEASSGQKLYEASRVGNLTEVKRLSEGTCEHVNWKQGNNYTSLHLAAEGDHIEVVKYLLACNANIDIQSYIGETALIMATEKGHFNVAKELIENGANLWLKTDAGDTPLVLASRKGFTDIVQLINPYSTIVNTTAKIHTLFVLMIIFAVTVFILVLSLIGVCLYFRYKLRSLQLSSQQHALAFNNDENQEVVHIYEN